MDTRLAGYRVMVVEDEFFLAADLLDALDRSGAEIVGPLADLDAALNEVQHDHIDLATVDINLGGDMAYPLADTLMRRNVPFIFATAYAPDDIPERFRRVPQVTKPYTTQDIVGALSALAGTRFHRRDPAGIGEP